MAPTNRLYGWWELQMTKTSFLIKSLSKSLHWEHDSSWNRPPLVGSQWLGILSDFRMRKWWFVILVFQKYTLPWLPGPQGRRTNLFQEESIQSFHTFPSEPNSWCWTETSWAQSGNVHERLNASWKISSLAVNGQSFLVIDGYLLNPEPRMMD